MTDAEWERETMIEAVGETEAEAVAEEVAVWKLGKNLSRSGSPLDYVTAANAAAAAAAAVDRERQRDSRLRAALFMLSKNCRMYVCVCVC